MQPHHLSLRPARLPLGLLLCAVAAAQDAPPQGGAGPERPGAPSAGPSGLPEGVTREQMWPAPTADDWKKPCLITWQRSWEDAVSVSQETGRPLLVCINMDGEIASEHYAGVRYRDPEIARLYEPYVCVIASVYRHNPRDYDEQGARIPCPRFGTVTCGEHIAIEPGLFEQFMDGKRIAPRHIGVELDKSEMYDVYYAWDTDTIFNALREGIANRPAPPVVHKDRPLEDRVASRDVLDRVLVETTYREGGAEQRRALLAAAAAHADATPVEMLRLAIFGLDVELARAARHILAQTSSPEATDLIAETLRVPMDAAERDALIEALARLGAKSPRARMLASVFGGLAKSSSTIPAEVWARALSENAAPAASSADRYAVESRLEQLAQATAAKPDDPAAQTDLAESYLALATDPATARRYARVLFEDARRTARDAERLGAQGWRVNAVLSIAAYYLDDRDEAVARAQSALTQMPADVQSWNSAAVLAIFAEARQRAISDSVRDKQDWPAQWMTDVHAAYSVLVRHPFGTDAHVVNHYDFLKWFGATAQSQRVLDEGLARFPTSWVLHDRLRARILQDQGVAALEPAYDAWLARPDAPADLESLAGYAALVAAEFHRRAGDDDAARASYERGIAHYERWIERAPEQRATADHYVALALAGRARVAYEHGEDAQALEDVLAAFARKPESAASLDGLNITPVDTARMLLARLRAQKQDEMAARLQAALDALAPELLELPAYERAIPGGPSPDARRFGGRRGGRPR